MEQMATFGLDIAKSVFQVPGLERAVLSSLNGACDDHGSLETHVLVAWARDFQQLRLRKPTNRRVQIPIVRANARVSFTERSSTPAPRAMPTIPLGAAAQER